MESRRLSRRRARPLRRLPYAAQRARGGEARRCISPAARRRAGWRMRSTRRRRRPCRGTGTASPSICATAGTLMHGVSRGPMAEVTGNLGGAAGQRRRRDRDLRRVADGRAVARSGAGARRRSSRKSTGAGLSAPTPRPTARRPAADDGTIRRARRSMRSACATCHESGRPPPFGGLDFALEHGRQCAQPAEHRQRHAVRPAGGRRRGERGHAGLCRSARRRADRVACSTYMRERFTEQPPWAGRCRNGARDTQRRIQGQHPAGGRNRDERPPMWARRTRHGDDTQRQRRASTRSTPIPRRRCSMCCATISS